MSTDPSDATTVNPVVHGQLVDGQSRCSHYFSVLDVVAIQFECCGRYYACDACHSQEEIHQAVQWDPDAFDARAILCGVCRHILTIQEYFDCGFVCPSCGCLFNPGCARHYHRYFQVPADGIGGGPSATT